jgi:hypothetical protein
VRGGGVRSASPSEALMPVSNHWRVKDDVRFGSLADILAATLSVRFSINRRHSKVGLEAQTRVVRYIRQRRDEKIEATPQ